MSIVDKAKAAVTGKGSSAHPESNTQAGSGVGSGTTGTGLGSGTSGTGMGGAHPVVTNSNLSSTPILGGEGVSNVAGHTHTGSGSGMHSGHTGSGTASSGKGSEYDATGGQVDDRSMMQKGMDAIKPGSQVGQHGKK